MPAQALKLNSVSSFDLNLDSLVVRQSPDSCLAVVWQLSGSCLTVAWQLLVGCQTSYNPRNRSYPDDKVELNSLCSLVKRKRRQNIQKPGAEQYCAWWA